MSIALAETMGRRREPRVFKGIPVRVRGADENGHSFVQDARALEISSTGARLEGLPRLKGPGTVIDVEFNHRRARFVVVWMGLAGTPEATQAGLSCLEPAVCMWGEQLPSKSPDHYSLPEAPIAGSPSSVSMAIQPPSPWTGNERRRSPRYKCQHRVEVSIAGSGVALEGTLTDVSLCGCYVEALMPLPVETEVVATLMDHGLVSVPGMVLISQPGIGMAIAFSEGLPGERRALERFVEGLRRGSAEAPLGISARVVAEEARSVGGASERVFIESAGAVLAIEALVECLEQKGVLTRDDFRQTLERALSGRVAG